VQTANWTVRNHIVMNVGFEVLTAVVMKSSVSWDMPCSMLSQPTFRRNTSPPVVLLATSFMLVSCFIYCSKG
jgi:hypothetical protein